MDPLCILPKEIWTRIFELVSDQSSLLSCYYTCCTFKSLLERRVMTEALLVMQHHLVKADHNRRKCEEYVMPSVVVNKELLQCRLVCRSWKHSIDHFLEIHPYHHNNPHGFMTVDASIFAFHSHHPTFSVSTKPKAINRIEALTSWYQGRNQLRTSKSKQLPFPGRRLRVNVEHPYNYRLSSQLMQPKRFRTALLECLSVTGIGDQLHHFEYSSDLIAEPLWYEIVYECLKLMPNLRTFCLSLQNYSEMEPPTRRKQVTCQMTDFVQFVKATPFPQLNHLVTVHLKEAPSSFQDSLLYVNKSVRKLSIENMTGDNWLTDGRSDDMPNLMDFSIGDNFIPLVPHLDQFNWPLTKLTIGDKKMNTRMTMPNNFVSEMFPFLEKFRNTLKELTMNVHWPELPDASARLPLLPQLEKLRIEFTGTINLNFILPLSSSLKILKIDIENRSFNRHDKENLLLFEGYIDRLEKSNLWDYFPHLKIVQVNTFCNLVEARFRQFSQDRRQKYTYRRGVKGITRTRKRFYAYYL